MLDPADLETFPPWEPERIAGRAVHVVLECSGKKAAMEAGFHQLRRGGTLALVGAGIEHPSFDPNRFILNELDVVGSFVYDEDGFEQALGPAGIGRVPRRSAHRARRRRPSTGSPTPSVGLAEGRFAGKVMVVPRLSDGGPATGLPEGVMTHPYYPSGNPRFNHVAMSLAADLLDEHNRADICRFWGEVFGFDEMPTS